MSSLDSLYLSAEAVHSDKGVIPWPNVLGAMVFQGHLYVMHDLPSKPATPWMVIGPTSDRTTAQLAEMAQAICRRLTQHTYRETPRVDRSWTTETLLAEVSEGRRLPGALEVAIGDGPTWLSKRIANIGAVVIGTTLLGLSAGIFTGAIGGLIATGLVVSRDRRSATVGGRILVLTPQGFVVGLEGGPKAFLWNEIAGFSVSRSGPSRYLEVEDGRGIKRVRMESNWFRQPVEFIAALAETYRAIYAA